MADEKITTNPGEPVAPGYPATEALKDVDVSDWEPAAVFRPVVIAPADESDGAK